MFFRKKKSRIWSAIYFDRERIFNLEQDVFGLKQFKCFYAKDLMNVGCLEQLERRIFKLELMASGMSEEEAIEEMKKVGWL